MQASLQFDMNKAEARKSAGMEAAGFSRADLLDLARLIARDFARIHGSVTADDVQRELIERGYGQLGNAAGSLFRGNEFVFTGEWRKSKRVSNHAHQNRVWRLR